MSGKCSNIFLSMFIFLNSMFGLFSWNELLKYLIISSFVRFRFTLGGASSLNNLNHKSFEGFV